MAANPAFMANIPPLTRISGPSFEPEAARVYAEAIHAIEEKGIPYLLGGTLAFHAHTGIWRDTKDIDFFCRPEDATRFLDALHEAGFEREVVYESWLGKGWKGDVFVDVIWRNANALMPVTDAWFETHASIPLFGRDVPVVPLEELLCSKMMVMGRYRYDGADMLHVFFAAAERIDWDRLARLSGEHIGLMLSHMHTFRWAYPGWRAKIPDEVIDRYTKLAEQAPSSFGPFRARLIDIQSFEVDVQEWGMPDPHRQVLSEIFGDSDGRQ